MRVGLSDPFHLTYPKFRWVEHALQQNGHETVRLKDADALRHTDADLVLFSQNIPVDGNLLSSIPKKCPWSIWIFDLLGHGIGDLLLETTEWDLFDFIFCKNVDVLPCGHWLDQGAPSWDPPPKGREFDVLIPGRWRPSRQAIADRLRASGLDPVTAGPGWKRTGYRWLGNQFTDEQMRRLFGSAKVVVCDNYAELPYYWSDRVWLALAGGATYVGPEVDGLGQDASVWLWRNEREIPELVVNAIAQHNYEAAIERARQNTYTERIRGLFRSPCPS